MNSSPEDFDIWFNATHGGTGKPSWELPDNDTGLDEELIADENGT